MRNGSFTSSLIDKTLLGLFKKDILDNYEKGFTLEHGFDKLIPYMNETWLQDTDCLIEIIEKDDCQGENGHGIPDRILLVKYQKQEYRIAIELHNYGRHYYCGPERYRENAESKFKDRDEELNIVAGSFNYTKTVREEANRNGLKLWEIFYRQIRGLGDYLYSLQNLMVRLGNAILERFPPLKWEIFKGRLLAKYSRLYRSKSSETGSKVRDEGIDVIATVFDVFTLDFRVIFGVILTILMFISIIFS